MTWERTSHRITTMYGISKHRYTNSRDHYLFGPDQGSTIGPISWIICFILIWTSVSTGAPKVELTCVSRDWKVSWTGDAFVDDNWTRLQQTYSRPKIEQSAAYNKLVEPRPGMGTVALQHRRSSKPKQVLLFYSVMALEPPTRSVWHN